MCKYCTIFWPNTPWLLDDYPSDCLPLGMWPTPRPTKSGETVDLFPIRKRPQQSFLCTRGLSLSPQNACLFNLCNFESSLLLCSDLLIIHLFIGYLLGSNHIPNTVIGPENIIMGLSILMREKNKTPVNRQIHLKNDKTTRGITVKEASKGLRTD